MSEPRGEPKPQPFPDLGRAVKRVREAAGLSQPELARRVGVSTGYMGHIEVGRNRPSPEVLSSIALHTGSDYDELAAIAGYRTQPAGDVPIYTTAEKAAIMRRLAGRTADQLRRMELAFGVWLSERLPEGNAGVEGGGHEQAEHETEQHTEEDAAGT